jgi:hypothetical protein
VDVYKPLTIHHKPYSVGMQLVRSCKFVYGTNQKTVEGATVVSLVIIRCGLRTTTPVTMSMPVTMSQDVLITIYSWSDT